MKNLVLIFYLGIALGANFASADDVVVLINGDRLTGKIVNVTDDVIVFESPHLGGLTISRAAVKTFGPAEQIAREREPKTGEPEVEVAEEKPKLWKGSCDAGYNLTKGAKDAQNAFVRFELGRERGPSVLHFRAQGFWGETEGETTAQKADGRVKYEYEFNERAYVLNQLSGAYDRIRELDAELQNGVGAGYRLIRTEKRRLSVEAGPNYLFRSQRGLDDVHALSLRFGESCRQQINEALEFSQEFEFLQRADRFEARQFRGEATLRVALPRAMALKLTLLDEYDTAPAAGVPKNSLQFITSLGVTF
jgi:putative salt-induced outer membrane protein YdiY